MATIFNLLSDNSAEPQGKNSVPEQQRKKATPGGNEYVTREDMARELSKLQQRMEERLHAERNKRAERNKALASSMHKRCADMEAQTLAALQELQRQVTPLPSGKPGGALSDIASSVSQWHKRLTDVVAGKAPADFAVTPPSSDKNDEHLSVASMNSKDQATLLEELKIKVDRLERGTQKLVLAAAEASVENMGMSDAEGMFGDGGTESDVDGPAFADQAVGWTTQLRTRLDELGTDIEATNDKVADIESTVATLERSLDNRIKAVVRKEIQGSRHDRGSRG